MCVSLDLAKRLKELNVPQNAYFKYELRSDGSFEIYHSKPTSCAHQYYSAFTSEELLELVLPIVREIETSYLDTSEKLIYIESYTLVDGFSGINEADARARMLIELIENGLYKPEEK